MNAIPSVASEPRACGGTAVSPLSQVLNEKRPAKKPSARRSISGLVKRMMIMMKW